jgi:hypothetical protein
MIVDIDENERLFRAAQSASRKESAFILVVVVPVALLGVVGCLLAFFFPVFSILSPLVAVPLGWAMVRMSRRVRALRQQCIANDVCPHCGRHKSLEFSSLKGYRCTECASMFTSSGNVASK